MENWTVRTGNYRTQAIAVIRYTRNARYWYSLRHWDAYNCTSCGVNWVNVTHNFRNFRIEKYWASTITLPTSGYHLFPTPELCSLGSWRYWSYWLAIMAYFEDEIARTLLLSCYNLRGLGSDAFRLTIMLQPWRRFSLCSRRDNRSAINDQTTFDAGNIVIAI